MQEELEGEPEELGEKEQMRSWEEKRRIDQMQEKEEKLAGARITFNASMDKLNGELDHWKR
jgi:hypothetical protein